MANHPKKNLAVFASGSGSNFETIAKAVQNGEINANMALLVCNKPTAGVIARAEKLGVTTCLIDRKAYASREAYEAVVLQALTEHGIDFIALAGYMLLVGPTLLDAYQGRMVNIHPSLLPAFAGANGIADAFAYGVKVSGVTIHWVDAGMDTGQIIAQEMVRLSDSDTLGTFSDKIHAVEHKLYVQTLRNLL